jgi:hypothetical protein
MPTNKNNGTKYNWQELETEFRNSKHKNVSTFFKEQKGWTSNQLKSGNFLRKTASWSANKEMILKTNYISKLISNDNYMDQSLELLERSKIKTYIVDKLQVSKLAALESLHLGLMVVLEDLQNKKMGSVDFLKYSKSLLDVVRFSSAINGVDDDGDDEREREGQNNQIKPSKVLIQAYRTPEPTE